MRRAWLFITNIISTVINTLVLTVVYYIFFVPYALLLKLFGKHFFIEYPTKSGSYWQERPMLTTQDKLKKYQRQF